MTKYFTTAIGRLRLLAFFEGLSLLILVFIGVPMKHFLQDPALVKAMGPIHGALFLIVVLLAFQISIAQNWKFKETTWKILVACIIPFGTFYIDHTMLSKMSAN